MRRIVLCSLLPLLAASASPARASDFDLEIGVRSFGPDQERWPAVGVGLRFGPDAWRVKPTIGAAWAAEPLYGGTVTEGRAGIGGDLPHRGRATWSWGLGYARLRYDFGANQGSADAGYGELALRWVRPDDVDFGISLRYLDGGDITLRYDPDPNPDNGFHESISTVVVSFLMRW
jgi:hypothetical protein